jgi:hypothetical protein
VHIDRCILLYVSFNSRGEQTHSSISPRRKRHRNTVNQRLRVSNTSLIRTRNMFQANRKRNWLTHATCLALLANRLQSLTSCFQTHPYSCS